MPGSLISRTRQPGRSALRLARNSCGLAKASDGSATDNKRSWIDRRTLASSSTIKTTASSSVLTYGSQLAWQSEVESCAPFWVRIRPKSSAVRLDDCAADRQPHTRSPGLGSDKRFEDLLYLVSRYSGSGVTHRHFCLCFFPSRAYLEFAALLTHRFHPV